MKRIAVLTSGGDAPGMNAAVRAVVRTGIDKGWKTFGVRHGYAGLLEDNFVQLGLRDVSNIMQRSGTFLGSKGCEEFKTEEAQLRAVRLLRQREIDALIVIGGDGSQAGSSSLSRKEFPVVGVASTIDNDLCGSEITIGVDTALNVALEAIERLKVTASSHERAFLVEVMGRDCGYLALMSGMAGGAKCIVLPEVDADPHMLACELRAAYISMAKDTGAQLPATVAARAIAIGVVTNTLLKLSIGVFIGVGQFQRIAILGLFAVAVACVASLAWLW